MFFIFIFCNGLERFFIEFIRVNPRHCLLNVCLTQAQYTALAFLLLGISGLVWLFVKKRNTNVANAGIKDHN